MRVIVSKTLQDNYQNFVVVDNFKKVRGLSGVTLLVIHNFEESDFDTGVFISEFKKNGIKNILYINENPNANVKNTILGIKGKYIEDEFYFEDEEELLALVEECEQDVEEETSLATVSTDIINDFIERFKRGDEQIQAPVYLEQVREAVNELSAITQQQQTQLLAMGSSAMETFERASVIISNLAKQKKTIEDSLKNLEESRPAIQTKSSMSGSILFYPTYNYTGSAKVLVVREYSPCRYLTSFILAYEHYLHYSKNKRVKLIFVHQKGHGVLKKYTDYTSITQESMYLDSLYDAEIIATNNPKKDVLKKIFSRPADVFIIVDRMYGQQDIVSGRRVKVSAVSGSSDLKRFNVKENECIFSVNKKENALFTIPSIKNYPTGKDVRNAAYMQICKNDMFVKLDSLLQLPTEGGR